LVDLNCGSNVESRGFGSGIQPARAREQADCHASLNSHAASLPEGCHSGEAFGDTVLRRTHRST
jgi:hypothetical protein